MNKYEFIPKKEELIAYAASIFASAAMYVGLNAAMDSLEQKFQLDYNVPSFEQNINDMLYDSIDSAKEYFKREN